MITETVGFDKYRITEVIPEPASILLLGMGGLGLGGAAVRRNRKKKAA